MDLMIDEVLDKNLYYKKLSNDRVINITGEGGSGKSTIANEYRAKGNYLVVDYDLILLNPAAGTIEYELKQMLLKKYGNGLFENINTVGIEIVKENFTIMYNEIINYLSNKEKNKTIVLDGTQLRFISEAKMIKGEFVALRPSLQTCVSRSVNRYIQNNPTATAEQIQEYTSKRTKVLRLLNPMMNDLLIQVDKLPNAKDIEVSFDDVDIHSFLIKNAKKYLDIIKNEYGEVMSSEQLQFLNELLTTNCIKVDLNGEEYLKNQTNEINNSPNMTLFEKLEALRKLDVPLAHGGRVFRDNKIHFYPSTLLSQNPNLSINELKEKCNEILIHELLHFFIRPEHLDITNFPELKGINDFTTEGLVDMCARDIQQKYGLFPKYNSEYGTNVIFVREALSSVPSVSDRMRLIFNGSIQQIYQQTSTEVYNSYEQFVGAKDKKTKFDEVVTNISKICSNETKQIESIQRATYNLSANFRSKNESLDAIKRIGQQQFSDKIQLIQQQIDSYISNSDSKKLENNSQYIEPSVTKNDKPFDQRSQSEIQIAEQIRMKNQMMVQQQKQVAKPKTLVKSNPNVSSSNKGYINVVILSLIMIGVVGLVMIMIYF